MRLEQGLVLMNYLESGQVDGDDFTDFFRSSPLECVASIVKVEAKVLLDLISLNTYSELIFQSCL
jgi:hypothetical protein